MTPRALDLAALSLALYEQAGKVWAEDEQDGAVNRTAQQVRNHNVPSCTDREEGTKR